MPYQTHIWAIYGSPPFQKLDFQLGARVFSAGFLPLEPTIPFHTRQRFPLPNHVTSGCMSPRSLFSNWSAVSPTGSSSGHVIALDQSEASIWAKRAQCTTDCILLLIICTFLIVYITQSSLRTIYCHKPTTIDERVIIMTMSASSQDSKVAIF